MNEEHRQRTIRAKLARMDPAPIDSIPTGLGFGSLPRASIVELFGPAGSGKTSVALSLVAQCQNAGGAAGWIDADHTFDPAYAVRLGAVIERLPVARPESAEQAFAILTQLALSGAVELLIVDSAAALVPALELETALGESGPGLQNRVFASALRKLAQALGRSRATVVFLNQTRSRAGEGEASAGGAALKLHAGLRISLDAAGRAPRTRFHIVKNKAGVPFREGEVSWNPPDDADPAC